MIALDHVRHGRLVTVSGERLLGSVVLLLAHTAAVAALLVAADRTLADPTVAWPVAMVLSLAVLTALAPDSATGLATLTVYAAWWLLAVPGGTSGWVLVAALALLAGHAATAYLAAGPASLSAEPALRVRWLRDVAVVGALTCAGWLVARLADGTLVTGEGVLALTLLLLGLGFVALARSGRRDDEDPP